MNEQEKLESECFRLSNCNTILDCIELIDIYSEFLFQTIRKHHNDPISVKAEADAKLILQMMLTKTLHLKSAMRGVSYESKDGAGIKKIIDPGIIALHIRNIYETVGTFNLIYSNTKSKDEQTILYYLWVHSGVKYRQRFENKDNTDKFQNEKKQLEEIVKIIEDTELFQRLDNKCKGKIRTCLKKKEYKIEFENNTVKILSWQDLAEIIGNKNCLLDEMYTYFCLYAHPSNVSVFQFGDMFNEGVEFSIKKSIFNLKYFFMLTSIFIVDYIKLFPLVRETFNCMNIRDQFIIDFHNMSLRGREFSIIQA